jgi:ABC-type lipoprotein export system ATPase subunit
VPVTLELPAADQHFAARCLEARQVTFRYPQAPTEVVRDFSYSFLRGTLTAIVAPSGAGKSTLLSLLGLLLRPDAGQLTVDGQVADWRRSGYVVRLRNGFFSWVLQNSACFEARTALDNVAIGLLSSGVSMRTARVRAGAALAAVGLSDQMKLKASQLSGGEQQRMTIARALLSDRPYLLADEPTGNLDRANSTMVFAALRACADHGASVIVATHDVESAAIADDIIDLTTNAYSAPAG